MFRVLKETRRTNNDNPILKAKRKSAKAIVFSVFVYGRPLKFRYPYIHNFCDNKESMKYLPFHKDVKISKFATNRLDFQNFKLVRISALIVGWEPKHDTVRYYAKLRVPTGQAIKG